MSLPNFWARPRFAHARIECAPSASSCSSPRVFSARTTKIICVRCPNRDSDRRDFVSADYPYAYTFPPIYRRLKCTGQTGYSRRGLSVTATTAGQRVKTFVFLSYRFFTLHYFREFYKYNLSENVYTRTSIIDPL